MSPISFPGAFPLEFNLMCPEPMQIQLLGQYMCNSIQFFGEHNEIWLWNTLAKCPIDVQRVDKFQPRAGRGRLSSLERLPYELLEQILDVLLVDSANRASAIISVLALGLSSATLWPRVLRRIHDDYRRTMPASWAGRRISFHSDQSFFNLRTAHRYAIEDPILAKRLKGQLDYHRPEYQHVSFQPEWSG